MSSFNKNASTALANKKGFLEQYARENASEVHVESRNSIFRVHKGDKSNSLLTAKTMSYLLLAGAYKAYFSK